jgi:hypothetical protein
VGPGMGQPAGLGRLAWAHLGPVAYLLRVASVPESSRSFPFCMWALVVSFCLSWTKLLIPQDSTLFWVGPQSLSSSRVWSLGFLESSLLHCMTCTRLQGLFKVLDQLIPGLLLSTSKPCINTKLQNDMHE